MDLKKIAVEINEALEQRRQDLEMKFVEEKHMYWMKDIDGKVKTTFPSVSKIVKLFHADFDAEAKSLEMCNGDVKKAAKLQAEWKREGSISTNLGSRTHYILEKESLDRFGYNKLVREPVFECDASSIIKSDNMVVAGKKYIDLMESRGAVLIDTEVVLGDPEIGCVGQADKMWVMETKDKTSFGLICTDWKTNKPKNFVAEWYNGYMYEPFKNHRDYALTHYNLQLPFYGKLMVKMLQESLYKDIKFLGGVVVLLKETSEFVEYKVPVDIVKTVMSMNIKEYLK